MNDSGDDKRAAFLKSLDDAVDTIEVSNAEAKFLEQNLEKSTFSPEQRQTIDRMIAKYKGRL